MSDKLQFYKFYPSDWMMGRIQKCSGDCVKAFINFTCLYWNKECQVLIEDARIELEEHYETLVKYKIIVEDSEWIKIKYLEEQNNEISEKTKSKSIDGRKGNLKRWHPELYSKVCDGKISLKQAEQIVKQSNNDSNPIADLSHSDSNPIATQSQNIADKDKDKDKDNNGQNEVLTLEPSFDEFYDKYAYKQKRQETEKAWKKLSLNEKQKALKGIESFRTFKEKTGQSMPYPASYLNSKRWEDDFALPTQTKTTTNGQGIYKPKGGDFS